MVDPIAWLGEWEPIESVGKHDRIYPAPFAHGYQWRGPVMSCQYGNLTGDIRQRGRTRTSIPMRTKSNGSLPSWYKSPQVRFWLEEEKVGVWKRFVRWLKKGALE